MRKYLHMTSYNTLIFCLNELLQNVTMCYGEIIYGVSSGVGNRAVCFDSRVSIVRRGPMKTELTIDFGV
jgi:hypothetical protein